MGFVLGLRYLMGWSLASHPANRELPEWPPHPDRIFMALAAAHFETDGDSSEKEALEWLEAQPAPVLYASRGFGRKVVTTYVPVNDTQMSRWKVGATPSEDQMNSGLKLLPSLRSRQARQFPTAILENDVVYLEWTESPPENLHTSLTSLCQKVTRVGHSASLVQMWSAEKVEETDEHRRLAPTDGLGGYRLRTPGVGRMRMLSNAYDSGRRPPTSPYRGYTDVRKETDETPLPESEFTPDFLVMSPAPGEKRRLTLVSTQLLTYHLRRLLMSRSPNPLPEWLSGHVADGGRSEQSHLALIPLAHVGREHADGHLLGLGIVAPRNLIQQVGKLLGTVLIDPSDMSARLIQINLGEAGEWRLHLDQRDELPQALQTETWTSRRRGSKRWATVTPFVLDRHAKGRDFATGAASAVKNACKRIGLPEPIDVQISKVSPFTGTPSVFEFAPIARKDGSFPQQTHCTIEFSEAVVGPVLIGAGRYRGYGLCRPIPEGRNDT